MKILILATNQVKVVLPGYSKMFYKILSQYECVKESSCVKCIFFKSELKCIFTSRYIKTFLIENTYFKSS